MYSKPCHPLFGDLNYIVIFFDPIIYVPLQPVVWNSSGAAQSVGADQGRTVVRSSRSEEMNKFDEMMAFLAARASQLLSSGWRVTR